jgi:SAM-dependent methyltransferase
VIIVDFTASIMKQCRRPEGWLGRIMVLWLNLIHSSLTDWGLTHIEFAEDATILDVGCGGGRTIRKLAEIASAGNIVGIDYSEDAVAVSRRTNRTLIETGRVEVRRGTVYSLPFPDDAFDLVTAIETHYFWPNLADDLQEVKRVLNPGGVLAVIGEGYKNEKYGERNQRWGEQHDIEFHSVEEFHQLLAAAGYSRVEIFEDYDRGWICAVGTKPEYATS